MRGVAWLIAFSTLGLLPVVGAQLAEPSAGCGADGSAPVCDPLALNGGAVKTGDEVVTIVAFAHQRDLLMAAVLNMQRPDPWFSIDPQDGFLAPTIVVETGLDIGGTPLDIQFESNLFTWQPTPTFVEPLEGDAWRVMQGPSLGLDLELASDFEAIAYFGVSTRPNSIDAPTDAGVLPAVGMYARIDSGRYAFRGTTLAEGDTGTGWGSPAAEPAGSSVTLIRTPGQDAVYEFKVRLERNTDLLSFEEGYVVSVAPYQLATQKAQFTQGEWELRGGVQWAPRLVFDVRHPLQTYELDASWAGSAIEIKWGAKSAFGGYDVDPSSFELELLGPNSEAVAAELVSVHHSTDHDGTHKPAWVTWRVYGEALNGAAPYTARMSAMNTQHTYRLVEDFEFVPDELASAGALSGAEPEVLPGPPIAGVVLATLVGALALARRMRRS